MTPAERELVERTVRIAVASISARLTPADIDALAGVLERGFAAFRVLCAGARVAPPLPPGPKRQNHPTLYSMRPVKR